MSIELEYFTDQEATEGVLELKHRTAIALAAAGKAETVPYETLVELFFEIGATLEEVGLNSFVIAGCGAAHRMSDAVVIDTVAWGRSCTACNAEFVSGFADQFGKDLFEMVASGSKLVSTP